MRISVLILSLLLAACTQEEQEVLTTSVNVDDSRVAAFVNEIDAITGNTLAVDGMLELIESTPVDQELQDRYRVRFEGAEAEILFHVWREQADWVHLYFSSESHALIGAIEAESAPYARDDEA